MSGNFDKDRFMEYLQDEFAAFDNAWDFLRGTISNLIDFGMRHHNQSKDQLGYFLSDILPGVEFQDVAMFIDDAYLTQNGQAEKAEAAAKLGREIDGDEALDDLISSALNFSRRDLWDDNPNEYDKRFQDR